VVGYLTTVLLTATRALDVVSGGPVAADGLPGWRAVGWLFYNAHGVRVRFVSADGVSTVDFIEAGGGSLAVLYLLPPVVLLLAGAVVAARVGASGPRQGMTAGATVLTGYGGALVLGVVPLGGSLGPYTAGPALPLLAAVGYPLAFGTMGGFAAAALSVPTAAERPRGPTDATEE
jgi:hypothetical protein